MLPGPFINRLKQFRDLFRFRGDTVTFSGIRLAIAKFIIRLSAPLILGDPFAYFDTVLAQSTTLWTLILQSQRLLRQGIGVVKVYADIVSAK